MQCYQVGSLVTAGLPFFEVVFCAKEKSKILKLEFNNSK